MLARAYSFARWSLLFAIGFVLVSACGRAALDDYIVSSDGGPTIDGGPDARPSDGGLCDAATCPTGCCDANGICELGRSAMACGRFGQTCMDCPSLGFQTCDPSTQVCGNVLTQCGPQNCSGCCEGNVCLQGADPNECGTSGAACQHCASEGFACTGGACGASTCGASTCPGCCFGDECLLGTDSTACGASGQQCLNCLGLNETCVMSGGGGACQTPTCGPQNCGGCCAGDVCMSGLDPSQCGSFGKVCASCTAANEKCSPNGTGGICSGQTCDPSNCNGCCANGTCQSGVSPFACGAFGQSCSDCSQPGEQCLPEGPGGGGVCSVSTQCGPMNCKGCCQGNHCVTGFDSTACGGSGEQCQNCKAFGDQCEPADGGLGGVCVGNQQCGPQSCPGCCQGNACMGGVSPFACGAGGNQCADCSQPNENCLPEGPPGGGVCTIQPACSPQNCAGCCAGNTCVSGNSPAQCGSFGQQCVSCTASNEVCVVGDAGTGGECRTVQTCDATTCPNGCCVGEICAVGTQNNECGTGGKTCQNCTAMGDTCQNQACITMMKLCNSSNCGGCCDATGTCQAGFLNTQCGQNGAACQDCQAMSSTCDTSANPRACQSQCPGPYAGCAAGVTTAVPPTVRGACSSNDLANAAAACAAGAGPTNTVCASFFATVAPACSKCLGPFDFDFGQATGIAACIAPTSSATCNHDTGCISDCVAQSCAGCDPSTKTGCDNQVVGGQCQTFLQQAQGACMITPLCSPGTYGGNFGRWLQGVGQSFCGP